MASRNPVLSDKVFTTASSADATMSTIDTTHDWTAPPLPGKTMTIEGTARASLFLIVLTIAAGAFGWPKSPDAVYRRLDRSGWGHSELSGGMAFRADDHRFDRRARCDL